MQTLKNDPPACTGNLLAMRDTLEVLGGKWKLLILHYLITRDGESNSFKEMERNIVGISAKMLSKELKSLEENKLIHREEMNTKPKTVQYSITMYGRGAADIIDSLVEWGRKHRLELLTAE
ncbi:winged helix-turn-helix transcriptional regulator [Sphingobacterium rhinopitheci]|uniref:winged helix-turn-helix transcriptional regulator n=1 Tax=Sphingobacterium rhinopitheci TaxID=2781960 RepID=UPI001F51A1C2|nr:helix-turn-helix domain-containing protein [Sphingobacterium rhinopitheci]MCI0920046.1 helix-turn-helix transcriptional regulator [Sphingobacterium rhinopitheci]